MEICRRMEIWLWDEIASSSCFYELNALYFQTFSMIFPNTELFINLKKSFSMSFVAFCLNSLFMSMYGFSHSLWLQLMDLSTFFKIRQLFKTCFKLLTWATYSILSCVLAISLSTFSSLFFSTKNERPCGILVIFCVFNVKFKNMTFFIFFIIVLGEIFRKFWSFFYPLNSEGWEILGHCSTIQVINVLIVKIWGLYIFIIDTHILIISFCITMDGLANSSLYSFFDHQKYVNIS